MQHTDGFIIAHRPLISGGARASPPKEYNLFVRLYLAAIRFFCNKLKLFVFSIHKKRGII